jgi:hypothetical protein
VDASYPPPPPSPTRGEGESGGSPTRGEGEIRASATRGESEIGTSSTRGEGEIRVARRERNRGWIWFFVVLSVLGAAAVVIPIVYNLSLQLTPEQVAQARERWRTAGLADYILDYQQKHTRGAVTEETVYRVLVNGRRVTGVICDGELTLLSGDAPALVLGPWPALLPGPCGARDVDGMFDHMEGQLREDRSLPRRPYATATFDSRDGHPTRYVRRIGGGAERLEWTVKLLRPGED